MQEQSTIHVADVRDGTQQKPKKKSISYYFRIDFETIQGRLTAGFLSMALISFVLIQGANYRWRQQIENRNTLLYKLYPLEIHALRLLDEVREAENVFEKALLFDNKDYLREFENRWQGRVLPVAEALKKTATNIQDGEVKTLANSISDVLLKHMKQEYERIREIYERKEDLQGITSIRSYLQEEVQNRIVPLSARFKETVERLLREKQALVASYESAYLSLDRWRPWVIVLEFAIAVAVAATIGSLLIISILVRIRTLRDQILTLAKGDLPPPLPESKDELNTLIRALNQVVEGLSKIKTFAQEVGSGRFDTDISVFEREGDLGRSLEEMKQQLKLVYEEEQKRAWASEGLAQFSRILRENQDDLEALSRRFVSNLSRYVGVEQVGIFLLEEAQDGEPLLQLKGAFAYSKHKAIHKEIAIGEGLVGQVFLEAKSLHITELPEDYLKVVTGMGAAPPRELFLVPLVYNEECFGVIEVASLHHIPEYKVKFIEEVAKVLASTVSSVRAGERTRLLLEESRRKTEEILEQEALLRQNAEELRAAQEELESRLNRTRRELHQMQLIMDSIADVVMVYDERGGIRMVNRAVEDTFGYLQSDLISSSIRMLINAPIEELKEVEYITSRDGERLMLSKYKVFKATRRDGIEVEVQMAYQAIDMERERLYVATIRPL
ncbi:PAS domain S-box-containing protein [Thermonema lapsum]|uniref:PAS domain S-box-containing protein n=1 Tax=Thermonema lapsum TaxID=28195 RepID=A0A846MNE2_9BACT|nr:PAS domain S-box protein [Thermonema lapsum]NIK72930.1 PAS domain S-box-containing protein [Thermonema lapsum]